MGRGAGFSASQLKTRPAPLIINIRKLLYELLKVDKNETDRLKKALFLLKEDPVPIKSST
jgi:hypothetical protein